MGFYGLQRPAQVTGDAGAEIIISVLTSLTEKFSQNHKAVDVVENNPMKPDEDCRGNHWRGKVMKRDDVLDLLWKFKRDNAEKYGIIEIPSPVRNGWR
ncbi:MAG: hypothetical protein HY879_15765 [Deltaproteobacteria bacterium]|nr:hypothetical protein [Deltaproteobacteria bacterium]